MRPPCVKCVTCWEGSKPWASMLRYRHISCLFTCDVWLRMNVPAIQSIFQQDVYKFVLHFSVLSTVILSTEPQCLYSFRTDSVHLFFSADAPRHLAQLAVSTVIHARWQLYRLYAVTKRCNKPLSVTLPSRFVILSPLIISLTFSCVPADLVPAQYARCAILNRASSEKLTLDSKY